MGLIFLCFLSLSVGMLVMHVDGAPVFTCFSEICNWKCQRQEYSYGYCLMNYCICDLNGKKYKWTDNKQIRIQKPTTTRPPEKLRPHTTGPTIIPYQNFWD